MAAVYVELMQAVTDEKGHAYGVIVAGDRSPDGRTWNGWLEFVPAQGGEPLRTPRETTQPNREQVTYWATGLTPVYIEGAFARARARDAASPAGRPGRLSTARRRPVSTRWAPGGPIEAPAAHAEPILDPFSIYQKSESLLRRQLGALEAWHLVNIIAAYSLSARPQSALSRVSRKALIDLIVDQVGEKVGERQLP